jgi:hypothetical protein
MFKTSSMLALCLLAGHAVAGELPSCNGNAPVRPAFDLQPRKTQLDARAVTLMAQWKEDSRTQSPTQAAENHNERVSRVYDDFMAERRNVYAGARCEVYSVKKCASTPGKKHECPMTVGAPPGTWFDAGLTRVDDDFQRVPTISSDKRTVTYTVKKTGKGSNTAGFRAPVGYLPAVSERYVDEDFAQVHAYFAPLVRISGHTGD